MSQAAVSTKLNNLLILQKNVAKQIVERKLTKGVDYRDQENLSFKRVFIVTQIIVDLRQIFCKTFSVGR